MGQIVVTGALMQCSFGSAPCPFVASSPKVLSMSPVGTIQNMTPANITTFLMCQSLQNPTVAAATTAAFGVLTPMPCVPLIPTSWINPGKVLVANVPILTTDAKVMCAFGGNISFTNTPQMKVNIK